MVYLLKPYSRLFTSHISIPLNQATLPFIILDINTLIKFIEASKERKDASILISILHDLNVLKQPVKNVVPRLTICLERLLNRSDLNGLAVDSLLFLDLENE